MGAEMVKTEVVLEIAGGYRRPARKFPGLFLIMSFILHESGMAQRKASCPNLTWIGHRPFTNCSGGLETADTKAPGAISATGTVLSTTSAAFAMSSKESWAATMALA